MSANQLCHHRRLGVSQLLPDLCLFFEHCLQKRFCRGFASVNHRRGSFAVDAFAVASHNHQGKPASFMDFCLLRETCHHPRIVPTTWNLFDKSLEVSINNKRGLCLFVKVSERKGVFPFFWHQNCCWPIFHTLAEFFVVHKQIRSRQTGQGHDTKVFNVAVFSLVKEQRAHSFHEPKMPNTSSNRFCHGTLASFLLNLWTTTQSFSRPNTLIARLRFCFSSLSS